MGEVAIAAALCGLLVGGEIEVRHHFYADEHYVRVDCETPQYVIEIAMDDTPTSRDSIHQAIFASIHTEKIPLVVVIDRDGLLGRYENELRAVTERLRIGYASCSEHFIRVRSSTGWFRDLEGKLSDLPEGDNAARLCDLSKYFPVEVMTPSAANGP